MFPFFAKENTMFAVPATREVRAVGVLLGGSGLARRLVVQSRPLAVLLKPLPPVSQEACGCAESCAAEVGPC
ncbi:MAG: hypothetical protein C0505_02525 [Leptothrix sp. (in: Bacteria)]|nr:hypothetical protein [Leptothrix sp. (in: b-proteobacteria)]